MYAIGWDTGRGYYVNHPEVDANGYLRWVVDKTFGEHQGDAMLFKEKMNGRG